MNKAQANRNSPALQQLNKEEKAKRKDFLKRRDKMHKEVQEISRKYKIDIVGALDYQQTGVMPLVAFVDVKDRYEQKAKEDKKIKPTLET